MCMFARETARVVREDILGKSPRMFPDLQTARNIPEIAINTSLGLVYCAAEVSYETTAQTAASAARGIAGAEQWETFGVLWDKERSDVCPDLDGKTTAVN